MHGNSQLRRLIIQNDQICRCDCRIRTQAAHGYTHIRLRQNRSIIHTISHKYKGSALIQLLPVFLHPLYLVFRQALCMHFIQLQCIADRLGSQFAISCKHGCGGNTSFPEQTNGIRCICFQSVCNQNVSSIPAVYCQMYRSTNFCGCFCLQPCIFQILCVSGQNLFAVNLCRNTVSGQLLHICNTRGIQFFSIGIL